MTTRGVATHRWGALVFCWAYRAMTSALVAMPMGYVVGKVMRGHPRGDGALWDAGGIWLVETARLAQPHFGGALAMGGLVSLLALFGWLLPLGALIASQRPERLSARACLARSAERFGPMALVLGGVLFLQGLLFGGFMALGRYLGGLHSHLGDVLAAVVPLLAFIGWWLLGLLHDAVRVVLIGRDTRWWAVVNEAGALLSASWRRTLWAGAWPSLIAWAVLIGAAAVTVDMTLAGTSPGAILLVHQLAIAAVVVTRAIWLGWLARALARRPEPAEIERLPAQIPGENAASAET